MNWYKIAMFKALKKEWKWGNVIRENPKNSTGFQGPNRIKKLIVRFKDCNQFNRLVLHLHSQEDYKPKKHPMKKLDTLWAVILLLLFFSNAFGQTLLKYNYTVNDLDQKPKAGVRVTAVETTTFDYMVFYTNQNGVAEITLSTGNEWSLNVGDMKGVEVLKMPEQGIQEVSSQVTLDPVMWELDNSPLADRSEIAFKQLKQSIPEGYEAQGENCIVAVELKDRLSNPWANIEVNLTSPAQRLSISAMTDGNGIARLEVPSGFYELDVDGERGFRRVGVPADTNLVELSYTFVRKDFTESVNQEGNTIQRLNETQKVVSNRVYLKLMITKQQGNLFNEKVLIRTANSAETYVAYTDQEGQVEFMLPKGHTYSVNFEYQENAATIDLTRMITTGRMILVVPYKPDERLAHPEYFLPKNEELKIFDINNMLTSRYEDTPDDNLVNFHAKWGNKKIGSGSQEVILEMGFSVKSGIKPQPVDKPVNLVFVLDKSGSMSFERMDFLKFAMSKMIEEMRPEDRASIVVFDTKAAIAYPLQPTDKDRLKDVVYAIQAGGGTSIYEGLKLGYENMSKAFDPFATNRVILLTDGYGSKPVDEILDMSQKYFNKGLAVSTIGIGASYNHNLLTLLSQYSGGLSHQVCDNLDIETAFQEEFESVLQPLASNFQVTVMYNDEIIYNTLFGIPEVDQGNDYVNFKIPNIFASMNQSALMKFKLDNPTPDLVNKPVIIRVTYFDEQKMQPVEIVKEMYLEWTDETDLEIVKTEEQKRLYSLAVINQCNKVIADLCENEDFEEAEMQIKETLRALKKTNDDKFSADLKPYIKQLEDYLTAIQTAIKKKPKKKDVQLE